MIQTNYISNRIKLGFIDAIKVVSILIVAQFFNIAFISGFDSLDFRVMETRMGDLQNLANGPSAWLLISYYLFLLIFGLMLRENLYDYFYGVLAALGFFSMYDILAEVVLFFIIAPFKFDESVSISWLAAFLSLVILFVCSFALSTIKSPVRWRKSKYPVQGKK